MGIGATIRRYRESKDMTQLELARRLGLRRVISISKWENGSAPVPWKHFPALHEELKIPLETLFKEMRASSPELVDPLLKLLRMMYQKSLLHLSASTREGRRLVHEVKRRHPALSFDEAIGAAFDRPPVEETWFIAPRAKKSRSKSHPKR